MNGTGQAEDDSAVQQEIERPTKKVEALQSGSLSSGQLVPGLVAAQVGVDVKPIVAGDPAHAEVGAMFAPPCTLR